MWHDGKKNGRTRRRSAGRPARRLAAILLVLAMLFSTSGVTALASSEPTGAASPDVAQIERASDVNNADFDGEVTEATPGVGDGDVETPAPAEGTPTPATDDVDNDGDTADPDGTGDSKDDVTPTEEPEEQPSPSPAESAEATPSQGTATGSFLSSLEAVLNGESEDLVRLTEDISIGDRQAPWTVPEDTSLTIDLDGHTLSLSATQPDEGAPPCDIFQVAGLLTLTDGSEDRSGKLSVDRAGNVFSIVGSNATMTFEAGTIVTSEHCVRALGVSEGAALVMGRQDQPTWQPVISVTATEAIQGSGGAILVTGRNSSATVWNGSISGAKAQNGGAISVEGGASLDWKNGAIDKSVATGNGGAIAVSGGAGTTRSAATIAGGSITGNAQQNGGAILVEAGGALTVTDGTIVGAAVGNGGAIWVSGGGSSATISGGSIQDSHAASGGALAVQGQGRLSFQNGSIEDSHASDNGGAAFVDGNAALAISGGLISGNTADGNGGAVAVGDDGELTLGGGSIQANTAKNGGAIWVGPMGSLIANAAEASNKILISDNSATKAGGGLLFEQGAKADLQGYADVSGNKVGGVLSNMDPADTAHAETFVVEANGEPGTEPTPTGEPGASPTPTTEPTASQSPQPTETSEQTKTPEPTATPSQTPEPDPDEPEVARVESADDLQKALGEGGTVVLDASMSIDETSLLVPRDKNVELILNGNSISGTGDGQSSLFTVEGQLSVAQKEYEEPGTGEPDPEQPEGPAVQPGEVSSQPSVEPGDSFVQPTDAPSPDVPSDEPENRSVVDQSASDEPEDGEVEPEPEFDISFGNGKNIFELRSGGRLVIADTKLGIGQDMERAIDVPAAAELEMTGSRITGCGEGKAEQGGAIRVSGGTSAGKAMVSGTTIENTTATYGGAVSVAGIGEATLGSGTVISNCSAKATTGRVTRGSGGALYIGDDQLQGRIVMDGATIENCTAAASGGAVQMDSGTLTMTETTIRDCEALAGSGGALSAAGGTAAASGSSIEGCSAAKDGGAVYQENATVTLGEETSVSGCKAGHTGEGADSAEETSAGNGGAAYVTSGELAIDGATISGCTATENGGAVCQMGGQVTMLAGTIQDCEAKEGSGGAFYVDGGLLGATLALHSGRIANNKAALFGKAIYLNNGRLVIDVPEGKTLEFVTASDEQGMARAGEGELAERAAIYLGPTGAAEISDGVEGMPALYAASPGLVKAAGGVLGETNVQADATEGDQLYAQLKALLAAAPAGPAPDPSAPIAWTNDGGKLKITLNMDIRNTRTVQSEGDDEPKIIELPIDVSKLGSITVGVKASLDLNGHAILASGSGSEDLITVQTGNAFTLTSGVTSKNARIEYKKGVNAVRVDGTGTFVLSGNAALTGGQVAVDSPDASDNAKRAVYVASGGKFSMAGGRISNFGFLAAPDNSDPAVGTGAAVFLEGSATLEMSGGTISGCQAACGGAVCVSGTSTATMTGGTISQCAALETGVTEKSNGTGRGGAFYVASASGKLDINGSATIEGCRATGDVRIANDANCKRGGGGIFSCGPVTVAADARIVDCRTDEAAYGGGVCLLAGSASLTMTGGAVSGCESGAGAGIYRFNNSNSDSAPQLTIGGATAESKVRIQNNTATGFSWMGSAGGCGYGGGIYLGGGVYNSGQPWAKRAYEFKGYAVVSDNTARYFKGDNVWPDVSTTGNFVIGYDPDDATGLGVWDVLTQALNGPLTEYPNESDGNSYADVITVETIDGVTTIHLHDDITQQGVGTTAIPALTVSGNKTINLHGYGLFGYGTSAGGGTNLITVSNGASLNLTSTDPSDPSKILQGSISYGKGNRLVSVSDTSHVLVNNGVNLMGSSGIKGLISVKGSLSAGQDPLDLASYNFVLQGGRLYYPDWMYASGMNTTWDNGRGINVSGSGRVLLNGGMIENCRANDGHAGGGVYIASTGLVCVRKIAMSACRAEKAGGAIDVSGGTLRMLQNDDLQFERADMSTYPIQITDNTATGNGGAIAMNHGTIEMPKEADGTISDTCYAYCLGNFASTSDPNYNPNVFPTSLLTDTFKGYSHFVVSEVVETGYQELLEVVNEAPAEYSGQYVKVDAGSKTISLQKIISQKNIGATNNEGNEIGTLTFGTTWNGWTFDLNGNALICEGNQDSSGKLKLVTVQAANFTITDSQNLNGTIPEVDASLGQDAYKTSGICLSNGDSIVNITSAGSVTLAGGRLVLPDDYSTNHAVDVTSGSFTMTGGRIEGPRAWDRSTDDGWTDYGRGFPQANGGAVQLAENCSVTIGTQGASADSVRPLIAGTYAKNGGAIYAAADNIPIRIYHARFENCGTARTERGGAIAIVGGTGEATIRDTIFVGNRARRGGAIYIQNRTATITGSSFGTETAVVETEDRSEANVATEGGAIAVTGRGSLTLTGTNVESNLACQGGGLWLGAPFGDTTPSSAVVTLQQGTDIWRNGTMTGNTSPSQPAYTDDGCGGGVYVSSRCTLNMEGDSLIRRNSTSAQVEVTTTREYPGDGGGVWLAGNLNMKGTSEIRSNFCMGYGGGVYVHDGGKISFKDHDEKPIGATGSDPEDTEGTGDTGDTFQPVIRFNKTTGSTESGSEFTTDARLLANVNTYLYKRDHAGAEGDATASDDDTNKIDASGIFTWPTGSGWRQWVGHSPAVISRAGRALASAFDAAAESGRVSKIILVKDEAEMPVDAKDGKPILLNGVMCYYVPTNGAEGKTDDGQEFTKWLPEAEKSNASSYYFVQGYLRVGRAVGDDGEETPDGVNIGAIQYTADITLDLHGCTIDGTAMDLEGSAQSTLIRVYTGSWLTITDSVGGGSIQRRDPMLNSLVQVRPYATLDVNSGTFINRGNHAIRGYGGDITLAGDTVLRDSGNGREPGGGVMLTGYPNEKTPVAGSLLIKDNVRITGNSGSFGGGVYSTGRFMKIEEGSNVEISGNEARNGGGIWARSLLMKSGDVHDNVALWGGTRTGQGGGLWVAGSFELTAAEIHDNVARNTGGGIYASWGTTGVIDGEPLSSTARSASAGYPNATVNIYNNRAEDSVMDSKSAVHGYSGGGIFLEHNLNDSATSDTERTVLEIGSAYITGNSAAYGGGVATCGRGSAELLNVDGPTIIGNHANEAFYDNGGVREPVESPQQTPGDDYMAPVAQSSDVLCDGWGYVGIEMVGYTDETKAPTAIWQGLTAREAVTVTKNTIARNELPGEAVVVEDGEDGQSSLVQLRAFGMTNEADQQMALAAAQNEAKCVIRGNSSRTGGGGIGGNGTLRLGRMYAAARERTVSYTPVITKEFNVDSGAILPSDDTTFKFSIQQLEGPEVTITMPDGTKQQCKTAPVTVALKTSDLWDKDAKKAKKVSPFGTMEFTARDEYVFQITEEPGNSKNNATVANDKSIWNLIVPVIESQGVETQDGDRQVIVRTLSLEPTTVDMNGKPITGLRYEKLVGENANRRPVGTEAQFANSVRTTPSTELNVLKTVNPVGEAADTWFRFELASVARAPMPEPNITTKIGTRQGAGAVEFGEITYENKTADYTYTITELAGQDAAGNAKLTYDATTWTVTVSVTASTADTPATITVRYTPDRNTDVWPPDKGEAEFVNTVATPGTGELRVTKTVRPDADAGAASGMEFEFQLVGLDGAPMPEGSSGGTKTIKSAGAGSKSFGEIEYTDKGEYWYEISEVRGTLPGVGYSDSKWKAKVTVDDPVPGRTELQVTIQYFADGSSVPASHAEIVNTLPGTAVLDVMKALRPEGQQTTETFWFALIPDNAGNPMPTYGGHPAGAPQLPSDWRVTGAYQLASTKGAGGVSFGSLTFNEADYTAGAQRTYTYTIREIPGSTAGVTYSSAIWTATVTVTRPAGGGELQVETSYTAQSEERTDHAEFVNTLPDNPPDNPDNPPGPGPSSDTYTPRVNKVLTGDTDAAVGQVFHFTVTSRPGTPSYSGTFTITIGEDGNRMSALTPALSLTGNGPYSYEIREEAGELWPDTVVSEYDSDYWIMTIQKGSTGAFTGSYVHVVDGREQPATGPATFTNEVRRIPDSARITAIKTIMPAGVSSHEQFEFTLTALDGAPMPEGALDGSLTVRHGAGAVDFGEIGYESAGEYRYEIRETAGSTPGASYDSRVWTAIVTVVERADGTDLGVGVRYERDGEAQEGRPEFVNWMPVPVWIVADKSVAPEGAAADELFRFELEALDGAPMPEGVTDGVMNGSCQGAGQAFFGPMRYEEPGTYRYRLHEVAGDNPDITYDRTVWDVTVTVTRSDDGHLETSIQYEADGQAANSEAARFVNNVRESDTIMIHARKSVVPEGAAAGGRFEFELEAVDGAPMPEGAEGGTMRVTRTGAGLASFGPMRYEEPGTYRYRLREISGDNPDITYDRTVWDVVVTVTEAEDGSLHATVQYDADGWDVNGDAAHFVNRVREPNRAFLGVRKFTRPEGAGANEVFEFELTGLDGAPMPAGAEGQTLRISRTGAGYASFGEIEYTTPGTFEYEIREVPGSNAWMTYDQSVWRAVVTVTEGEGGGLDVDVAYSCPGWEDNGVEARFANTLRQPNTAELQLGKTVLPLGGAPLEMFWFELEGLDGAPMPEGAEGSVMRVWRTGAGHASFGPVQYTEPGEYRYAMREVPGGMDGMTYDATEWSVTVLATDPDGDGTLDIRVVYEADGQPGDGRAEFVNILGQPDTATFVILKTVLPEGAASGAEFEFELEAVDGAPMPAGAQGSTMRVRRVGAGVASFGPVTYDSPGTYRYRLREVAGEASGITYDATVWTVTVVATKTGDGGISTRVGYSASTRAPSAERAQFINRVPGPTPTPTPTHSPSATPSRPVPTGTPSRGYWTPGPSSPKAPMTADSRRLLGWQLICLGTVCAMGAALLLRRDRQA